MTSPIIPAPLLPGDRVSTGRITPQWTSYTPQWTATVTNPTLGNGTLTGLWRYLDDRTVFVRIQMVVGSSTTVGSGQYGFSLPVAAAAGTPDPQLDSTCIFNGGVLYRFVGWVQTVSAPASLVRMYRTNVNTAESLGAWAAGANPVALAATNEFSMSGFYFIA